MIYSQRKNKCILVTGGTSGLGLELVKEFRLASLNHRLSQASSDYRAMRSYSSSKLYVAMMGEMLAERLVQGALPHRIAIYAESIKDCKSPGRIITGGQN